MLLEVFKFINQSILRRSKESTALGASVITILAANLKYDLRYRANLPLKLQSPNNTIQFPLPNRWSNNRQNSKQQFFMVIKQVSLSLKGAGTAEKDLINKESDRSKANIYHMRFTHTNNIHEIKQLEKIMRKYNIHGDPFYNNERQKLLAESVINGEHSYMLRAYGSNQYQLPESEAIDQSYRNQLLESFKDQTWNDENLLKAGLTKQSLIEHVQKQDGLYCMLFEDLQRLTKGDILDNTPKIYHGNEVIQNTHYMQSPYPVFVRTSDGSFLCIAIGYRYGIKNEKNTLIGNKVQFYSPFFAKQPEKVWRLAQSHLLQALFNDFHVRVHLGLYHFTTNQYNVPLYNYKTKISSANFENYETFMKYGIDIFNRGLEGVNVTATASLVHPVAEYSIVNKVFNFSQESAISLIAGYSNRVDLTKISPREVMHNQGISDQKVKSDLIRIRLDVQFYDIITRYVEDVYKIFKINELAKDLMVEINKQVDNMSVGGQKPRPKLQNPEDVLLLLKNLVFCWSGYHAHTFSGISIANYWHFRPRMLGRPLPHNPSEWDSIKIGDELPHTKILMEAGKLTESTTQRDADNMLLDIMKEQVFIVSREVDFNLSANIPRHKQLLEILQRVVKELEDFEARVAQVNAEREKERLVLNYLAPTARQASLNI